MPSNWYLRSVFLTHMQHVTKLHNYQYNVVGIATSYELDGPRIEPRWGRHFPHLSRQGLGPTHPPIQRVPGLFPGGKAAGRGADHSPPSSADVKERVELYLYAPFGPSQPVIGRTSLYYYT